MHYVDWLQISMEIEYVTLCGAELDKAIRMQRRWVEETEGREAGLWQHITQEINWKGRGRRMWEWIEGKNNGMSIEQKETEEGWKQHWTLCGRIILKNTRCMLKSMFLCASYSAGSLRWAGPGTSRGIWRRTRSSACLAGRYPTAAPRIRSSRWGWWLSTPQNCVESWRRWGRSEPAGSFYRRDFSAEDAEKKNVSSKAAVMKSETILNWGEETHQLFIAEGGGSHGGGDSSLTRVLH